MHHALIKTAAIAAAMALSAALANAAETKAPQAAEPAVKAQPAEKGAKTRAGKKERELLVDINRARKAQLMKLPGIDEALASKIIAGRPYRSKADLVTRDVIPAGVYEGLKRNVVAKPR